MARLRIKELAEKQGLAQYQLAQKSGVTPQLLNHYWNNHTQRVSLVHLERIAKALKVRVGDLIVSDESETQPRVPTVQPEAA